MAATTTNWSQLAAEKALISEPPVKFARTQQRYLPIFIDIAVVSGKQLWGQSLQNQVSHWRVHLVSRLYLLYLTDTLTEFL